MKTDEGNSPRMTNHRSAAEEYIKQTGKFYEEENSADGSAWIARGTDRREHKFAVIIRLKSALDEKCWITREELLETSHGPERISLDIFALSNADETTSFDFIHFTSPYPANIDSETYRFNNWQNFKKSPKKEPDEGAGKEFNKESDKEPKK